MDNFDCYGPLRPEVCGAIDGAHASFSEELLDLIFAVECFHE
jgi:hypothetical protein